MNTAEFEQKLETSYKLSLTGSPAKGLAEGPWFGLGWNRPEPLYGSFYCPTKLEQPAGIQMNDYLTVGATLGIPALFCFCLYLWESLAAGIAVGNLNARIDNGKTDNNGVGWLRAAWPAGAIVLLVGFWFDGGLFKLPTAAVFWTLLELGKTGEEAADKRIEWDALTAKNAS